MMDFISAERDLYTIRWRIRKIIPKQPVIITSAFSAVHGGLTGPQKKTIAPMCYRVV